MTAAAAACLEREKARFIPTLLSGRRMGAIMRDGGFRLFLLPLHARATVASARSSVRTSGSLG